jgi:hypothetical protein
MYVWKWKKHKKCCGANEAISITHMIEQEMDDLQEMLFIDEEQSEQFFEIVHGIWFSLFEQLDDGETILEKFIAS